MQWNVARGRLAAGLCLSLVVLVAWSASAQPPSPGPRGGPPENVQNLAAEPTEDGILLTWDHPYPVEMREMYDGPDAGEPAEFQVWRRSMEPDFEQVATLNAQTTEEYLDTDVLAGFVYEYAVVYYDGVRSCEPNEREVEQRQCETVVALTAAEGAITVHATRHGPAGTEFSSCEFFVRGHGVGGATGVVTFLYAPNYTYEPTMQEIPFEGSANASGGFDFVAGPFEVPKGSPAASRAILLVVEVDTEDGPVHFFLQGLEFTCPMPAEVPFFPSHLALAFAMLGVVGAVLMVRRR